MTEKLRNLNLRRTNDMKSYRKSQLVDLESKC